MLAPWLPPATGSGAGDPREIAPPASASDAQRPRRPGVSASATARRARLRGEPSAAPLDAWSSSARRWGSRCPVAAAERSHPREGAAGEPLSLNEREGATTRRAVLTRTRAGDGGGGEPCGPRRGRRGEGSLGCGPRGKAWGALLPPSSSSSAPERFSSSSALMAASERNGSHSISAATTSLISPISVSSNHKGIPPDATTARQRSRARVQVTQGRRLPAQPALLSDRGSGTRDAGA